MDPITIGLIIAGISAASSLAGAGINYAGNKALQEDMQDFNASQAELARQFNSNENELARQFNSSEAATAREFNLNADSTKYQRSIADLKTAGLNPLSFVGNAGSVSGPAASSSGVAFSNPAYSGSNNFNAGALFSSALERSLLYRLTNDKSFKSDMLNNAQQSANQSIKYIKSNISSALNNHQIKHYEHVDLTSDEEATLKWFYDNIK